jgi:hypothetical protein
MVSSHRVDLTNIEGDGEVQCPKCDTMLSPDDTTENTYTVVETIIGDDDSLEGLLIRCNSCKSMITLDGFAALEENDHSRIEISEALPESQVNYRTVHTLSMSGQRIGHLTVEYAQKEDVKVFKRLRKLRVGEPFRSEATIEVDKAGLEKTALQEITQAVQRKFKGLRDRDTYMVEVKDGRKTLIGRF